MHPAIRTGQVSQPTAPAPGLSEIEPTAAELAPDVHSHVVPALAAQAAVPAPAVVAPTLGTPAPVAERSAPAQVQANQAHADQIQAYVDEVRKLRRRVAHLEAELAVAKNVTSQAATAPGLTTTPSATTEPNPTGEQTVAADADLAMSSSEPAETTASAPVSNPGFAEAWDQSSMATEEELEAEEAFFSATSIDEQSRSWLLDD